MKRFTWIALPTVAGFAALVFATIPATSVAAPTAPPPLAGISTYCTAGTSTNGCVATMSSSGSPELGGSTPFVLYANNVRGAKNGVIRYSITGANNVVWCSSGSSFLCIKAPHQSTGIQNSGGTAGQCDGTLSLDFFPWMSNHLGALGSPGYAGQTFWCQAVYSDFPACKGTTMSNALEFTLLP